MKMMFGALLLVYAAIAISPIANAQSYRYNYYNGYGYDYGYYYGDGRGYYYDDSLIRRLDADGRGGQAGG